MAIVKDSVKMIRSRPVLGWGLGTFPEVYPSFRSFYTNYFVNEAHNDYVQMAVETGLAGFGLVCWFIALFYRRSLHKIERWRTDIVSAVTLASIIGVTGILVHSLVGFQSADPRQRSAFFCPGRTRHRSFLEFMSPVNSKARSTRQMAFPLTVRSLLLGQRQEPVRT